MTKHLCVPSGFGQPFRAIIFGVIKRDEGKLVALDSTILHLPNTSSNSPPPPPPCQKQLRTASNLQISLMSMISKTCKRSNSQFCISFMFLFCTDSATDTSPPGGLSYDMKTKSMWVFIVNCLQLH